MFLASVPVIAAGDNGLEGKLEAFRVVKNAKGEETFVPAENAQPSDLIEYRLTYENRGQDPVRNVYITDPIPTGTQYVVKSASDPVGAEVEFSIDEGRTFHAWPILITHKSTDGSEKVTEATPDMVTHIRWVVKETLPPEAAITLSYRTTIK